MRDGNEGKSRSNETLADLEGNVGEVGEPEGVREGREGKGGEWPGTILAAR